MQGQKYDDYQERFNKLYEKYELLANRSPGLFEAAMALKLYEGEVGRRVKAFQEGHGDPNVISTKINDLIKEDIEKANKNLESYMSTQMKMQSQHQVDEIIAKYQQSKRRE